MAKWGEGDPRWIVEERADAHNVNNWHWRESDASQWSRSKFKELFTGMVVEDANVGSCAITEVTAEGEASVSNRKNKIISFYEWDIKLKWRGSSKDDATTYKGEVLIPNMSEEYSPDEIDVEIKINKEDKEKAELKLLMKTLGIAMVRDKLQMYLDLLRTEYATQVILPPKDAKAEPKPTPPPVSSTNPMKKEMDRLTMADANNKNTGIKITTKKLTMTETFMTTVEELYLTLTLKERISAWSRSEVKKDAEVGNVVVLFDKNVEFEYVELVRDKKIVLKWRMKSWLDGHYSTVTMNLNQTPEGAKVTLEQSGVPENSVEKTMAGWKTYYWNAIKMTFGFGARIM